MHRRHGAILRPHPWPEFGGLHNPKHGGRHCRIARSNQEAARLRSVLTGMALACSRSASIGAAW
eukprot:2227378-Pyramimonas_sp.AAC.1